MSNMQRSSEHTTIAPEPSIDPTAAIDLKSSRVPANDAGKYPEDGPEGANALNFLPSRMPPASPKITSSAGVPIGMMKMPGAATSPLTPTNFHPAAPPRPCDLYHSTPFTRICGTLANVSTLLRAVGFCHKP